MEQQVNTPVSKSKLAQAIFGEIHQDGFVLPEGFKSPRAYFMGRCQEELGLTYNAASTYWQNCRRAANGGPMYLTGRNSGLPTSVTKPFVDLTEELIEERAKAAEVELRWLVTNEDGTILSRHRTRAEAKAIADADGNSWADSKKAEAVAA